MTTSKPSVAIFGIGPSGLAAAQAVVNTTGTLPNLFADRRRKSELHGCQFLHKPIPLTGDIPETRVNYQMQGDPGDYRVKVYGPNWHGSISPDSYTGVQQAWDIRATYDALWNRFLTPIETGNGRPIELFSQWDINARSLAEREAELRDRFDLIFSTIPLPALCLRRDEHQFVAQEIWAMGEAPTQEVPIDALDDTVICNGNRYPSWYRLSRIFGHTTAEWSTEGPKPPYENVRKVVKPLWTDCDCFPWIDRVGRYGAWMKGVLVSDVYELVSLRVKNHSNYTIMTRRKDWCFHCGRIAYQARANDLANGTLYRCQNGHNWEVLDAERRDRTRAHVHD